MTTIVSSQPAINIENAPKKLAGNLMGQMVNAMLSTLNMEHEESLFLSFMADEIGDKIAQSGLTDSLAQSLQDKLVHSQEKDQGAPPPKVLPFKAIQAYGGGAHVF